MRMKLAFGLLFAVAALLVSVMPATAKGTGGTPSLDPAQMTNVPYLAWNGEEVNLVKCYDSDVLTSQNITSESAFFARFTAEFNVLDWTGDPNFKPTIEQNTMHVFTMRDVTCVSGDVVSLHPGLAQIEMDVADSLGTVVFPKHVFFVAWMNLMAPTISEMSNANLSALSANQDSGLFGQPAALFGGTWPFPAGTMLGDPAGGTPATFMPIADTSGVNHLLDGLVSATVKGQFPNGTGGMWTMPDDWAALATKYATDQTGPNPAAWDIHGLAAYNPAGPFDPLRIETLLSDTHLTAADAPMPAARIDFKIAAGGVGGFDAASKDHIYIKDAAKAPSTDANAYEPFYQQFIPATDARFSSGIDGPAAGNNFQGFLVDGLYNNWALLNQTVNDPLRGGKGNVCKNELGVVRPSPTTPDAVSVYTDEHGQAIVAYDPDRGFYFTANNNGLCDLGQNVPANATAATPSTPVFLGSSTIQATALYPYKPVQPLTGFASNTLVKNVYGDPAKFLRCVPKDDKYHAFCVEVIRDIYGNPVAGAKVQFTIEPGGKLIPASLKFGGFDTTLQDYWGNATDTTVYALTNKLGQAGVELISTLGGQVDVLAENIGTRNGGSGIIRDACVNFSGSAITATYDGCAGGTGTPVTPPVVVTPVSPVVVAPVVTAPVVTAPVVVTPATPVSVGGVQTPSVVKAHLVSAKLVATKLGRYLQVKVTGPNKTATIKITLLGKQGKVLRTVTKTVPANKLVRVTGLTISKAVVAARIAVVS